jgi:signal peptidase II
MRSGSRRVLFWAVAGAVVVLDLLTKQIAVATLGGGRRVHLLGDWLFFRLVHNPGAAFGIEAGPPAMSRVVFMGLAVVALLVLGTMVRQTHPSQRVRLTTLALVCGGAVGNLIDRIRSARGVVDFIDVYIGPLHWPTFNVADMAVTCGAVALAAVLWQEGRASHERSAERADPAEA